MNLAALRRGQSVCIGQIIRASAIIRSEQSEIGVVRHIADLLRAADEIAHDFARRAALAALNLHHAAVVNRALGKRQRNPRIHICHRVTQRAEIICRRIDIGQRAHARRIRAHPRADARPSIAPIPHGQHFGAVRIAAARIIDLRALAVRQKIRELLRGAHRNAVDRRDHIAALQPCGARRTFAFAHIAHADDHHALGRHRNAY